MQKFFVMTSSCVIDGYMLFQVAALRHTDGAWKAQAVEQHIESDVDEEEAKTLEQFKQVSVTSRGGVT